MFVNAESYEDCMSPNGNRIIAIRHGKQDGLGNVHAESLEDAVEKFVALFVRYADYLESCAFPNFQKQSVDESPKPEGIKKLSFDRYCRCTNALNANQVNAIEKDDYGSRDGSSKYWPNERQNLRRAFTSSLSTKDSMGCRFFLYTKRRSLVQQSKSCAKKHSRNKLFAVVSKRSMGD